MATQKPKPPTNTQNNRVMPSAIRYAMLFASVVLVAFLLPYLGVILLAALIVFIFNPVYKAVLAKTKRSSVAILATLTTAFLAVILPITFVLVVTVGQVNSLVNKISSGELNVGPAQVQEVIDRGVDRVNDLATAVPGGSKVSVSKDDISNAFRSTLSKLLGGMVTIIKSAGTAFFGFISTSILFLFVVIGMLKHQDKFIRFIKNLSIFDDSINDLYLAKAAAMTKAMVKGQFIIAAIQGTLSAFSLWIVGIDFFWVFLTILIFLSFIPLGAGIVTIPIGIIMMLTGHIPQGIFIIAFHLLVVTNVDNVLRPKLVPKSAQLNSALLLLAVFSGIKLFGAPGVIFGPVLMILLVTTFEIFAKYNSMQDRPKLKPSSR